MKLGETPKVDVNAIPTGSIGVDWALGIGGLPRGRIIEVFGPESSGKNHFESPTSIAEAQKKGGVCAFSMQSTRSTLNIQNGLAWISTPSWSSQPDTGEQALEIVESLVRSGKIDVIVSTLSPQLTPKGRNRRRNGSSTRRKTSTTHVAGAPQTHRDRRKTKTVVIFINQIRMQIGVMFGNPETTPGGKALKFYTSVRIDIRRIAQIKKGDEVMGGRHA